MQRALMTLDTASLYFRAFFGVPDRRVSPDAPATNAASGLLDMVARLLRDHSPGAVVACWDADWRPAFRVDLLPSYKHHRLTAEGSEQVPDALQEQIPLIEATLVAAGIPPTSTNRGARPRLPGDHLQQLRHEVPQAHRQPGKRRGAARGSGVWREPAARL